MIKLAIFDLDGTLLDTLTTITHYVNVALQKYGIGAVTKEEIRTFIGWGARNLMTRVLEYRAALDKVDFEELFAYYNANYDADPYYLTEPYDSIPEVVSELKSRGVKLAVLSNKPYASTRQCIDRFFTEFDIVRGGSSDVPLKPSPDALYLIMRELSVAPDVVAYIGDSEIDIETMKNCPTPVALPIACTWGLRTEEELCAAEPTLSTVFVHHPKEIIKAISEV